MDRPCMAPPWTAKTKTDDLTIPIDPELLKIDADRVQNGERTHVDTEGGAIDPRLLKIDADTVKDGARTLVNTEDTPTASSLPGSKYNTQAGPSTSTTPESSNQPEHIAGRGRPPPIYSRPRTRPRLRPNSPADTRGREPARTFPPTSSTARRDVPSRWRSRRRTHSFTPGSNDSGLGQEHREDDDLVQQPLRGVLRNPFVVGERTHDAPPAKLPRDARKEKDAQQQRPWRRMSDAELRTHYAAAAVSNGNVVYVYDFVGYEESLGGGLGDAETVIVGDRREAGEVAAAASAPVAAPSATMEEADTIGDEDGAREFMRWVVEQEINSEARPSEGHGSMAPPLFMSTGPSSTEPQPSGSSTEDHSELGRTVFRVSCHEPPTLEGESIAFPSSSPISFKARQLLQQISRETWRAADRQSKWRRDRGGLMRQIAFQHGQRVAEKAAFQRRMMREKFLNEKEMHQFLADGTQAVASDGIIKDYDEALQRWGDLVTGTTAWERRQPWLLPPWKSPTWCDARWRRKCMPLDWTDGGRGFDWTERLYDRFHQEAWEMLPDRSGLWHFEIVSRDGETTLMQLSEEEGDAHGRRRHKG